MSAFGMEKPKRPVVSLRATCACGAVTVAVDGPIYSMFMCSCEDCQKATGSGHANVALANPADVTITGLTKSFTRPAASGASFTRWFCPECATPLYGQSSRALQALMLPVGLFGAATEWFVPKQLIFARGHRDWDSIAQDLPWHETYREAEAK